MERQTTGLTRAQYKALFGALSRFHTSCEVAIKLNNNPALLPFDQADLEYASEALRVVEALPLDTANWIETIEAKKAA
jgi:hypothetical protein